MERDVAAIRNAIEELRVSGVQDIAVVPCGWPTGTEAIRIARIVLYADGPYEIYAAEATDCPDEYELRMERSHDLEESPIREGETLLRAPNVEERFIRAWRTGGELFANVREARCDGAAQADGVRRQLASAVGVVNPGGVVWSCEVDEEQLGGLLLCVMGE